MQSLHCILHRFSKFVFTKWTLRLHYQGYVLAMNKVFGELNNSRRISWSGYQSLP